MSVFYLVWRAHSPGILQDSPESKSYGRLAVEWYPHPYEIRETIDPKQYYCIDYRELVPDPVATIGQVYTHFGSVPRPAFLTRLRAAASSNAEFKSAHHSTLEEFGLSREWIQRELGDILQAYQLEA